MLNHENAAQVAVLAEPCQKFAPLTTSKVQWVACLLIEGEPLPDGITTSYAERLQGLYDTFAQAMAAAEASVHQWPDAIGISAKRVEVLA